MQLVAVVHAVVLITVKKVCITIISKEVISKYFNSLLEYGKGLLKLRTLMIVNTEIRNPNFH